MNKVIAIMDKPQNCEKCVFGVCAYSLPCATHRKGYYCQLKKSQGRVVEDFDYDAEVHLSNCPLREVPEKKEVSPYGGHCMNQCCTKRELGWNACIDDILKGSEEHG